MVRGREGAYHGLMPKGPAARIGDVVICPAVTGVVPHVGGPITGPPMGAPVLINKMPAATMGMMNVCAGGPGAIAMGSMTVKINNMGAARVGDLAGHGGKIGPPGAIAPPVIIGD